MSEDPGLLGPWLMAALLFLVLLGSGRTLRGHWLGHPPFGAGIAVSTALGITFFSSVILLFGHFGSIASPFPTLLLVLAVLMALPGLFWTWRDYGQPAGLERSFGLGWFTMPAWFLLVAAVLISMVWISGALDFEGRGYLFERVGVDYEIGRITSDPEAPRDPFFGDEPLDLWLFGLGAAEAALALPWFLGIALLYGVCGLGWRLHSHGAGLLAAMVFAIVLFASDRPLLLAPALPATLVLLAVMILAVESRGRPNWGHSLTAGTLGGFALVSDYGAATMLIPLLLFGPLWCKLATDLDFARVGDDARSEPEPEPEAKSDEAAAGLDGAFDGYTKFGDEEKGGGAKWWTPLRHTAIGAAGLSLPLVPWLARSDAWTDDAFYGFRAENRLEFALRYDYEHFPTEPQGEPADAPEARIDWRTSDYDLKLGYQLKLDYRFTEQDIDFGASYLDEPRGFDAYLDATELGLGLGIASGFGLVYGSRKRRRQRLLYTAPAALGYGAGLVLGDFDVVHPSTLGLLSVTTGSSLQTFNDGCPPPGRNFSLGGTLATGGLALGLSGAYDCGYWDEEIETERWRPTIEAKYDYHTDWKVGVRYEFAEPLVEPTIEPQIAPGPRVRYDTPSIGPTTLPSTPQIEPEEEEESAAGPDLPRQRPTQPGYKPDIRPDVNVNPGYQTNPKPRPNIPRRY